MKIKEELVEQIREAVRKRQEGVDEQYLHGAVRVDVKHVEHQKFEARKGKFRMIVDEPADRGGTDEGPAPLEYFLTGAASCLMVQYVRLAIVRNVNLDDFEITAVGRFDRRIGGAFHEVVYDVKIKSNDSKEDILELAKEAERMCYVHNTLTKAGVKMSTRIYLNGQQIA